MRVRPPGAQILVAEDPRLGRRAVGDRGADLRGAIGRAGIEPVEAFAARDVRLQVGPVVDRGPALGRVGMLEPVAPVRQRHVVVDADEIDLRIGPERIEVEEHVARCRRPAGARNTPTSRPHSRSSSRTRGSSAHPRAGPDRPAPPDRCWRPSGSSSAPASRCRSGRRRPRPPPRRDGRSAAPCAAGPSRRACRSSETISTRDAEARGRGRAEQRRDLACGRGGLVHGPGEPRRRRTGDPPPPGERGLARLGGVVGIRVRQRVAGRHVHQDERDRR